MILASVAFLLSPAVLDAQANRRGRLGAAGRGQGRLVFGYGIAAGMAEADAACLRGALLADLRASGLLPGNPRVLMLAGLPGAGESEFARRVNARCRFLTLESDRLRKALFPRPEYTGAENRRLFDACHRVMGEFLGQGYPVLFDATNIRERDRAPVYDLARRYDAPVGGGGGDRAPGGGAPAVAAARGGARGRGLVGCGLGRFIAGWRRAGSR